MSTGLEVFNLADPLPQGRLSIEASAGTGKTFALSTLAARFIAERGVTIDQLLVVTFTRAAAAELKGRVRERLTEVGELLRLAEFSESSASDSPLRCIWSEDPAVRMDRNDRIQAAITDFDRANVTTIHSFVQQILRSLGTSSGVNADAELAGGAGAMLEQVASDVLVRRSAATDSHNTKLPSVDHLLDVIKVAINNSEARRLPELKEFNSDAAAVQMETALTDAEKSALLHRELVDEVISELATRQQSVQTMSFAGVVERLRDSLTAEKTGEVVKTLLADRFRVVLIDEFQDTDPVQWQVFDAMFSDITDRGDAGRSLIIVGDPKQAIYGFRGANVHTYLEATRSAGTTQKSIATNWRSDPAMLESLDLLLCETHFDGLRVVDDGDENRDHIASRSTIRFTSVGAAERNRKNVLRDPEGNELPPLVIRLGQGRVDSSANKSNSTYVTMDARFTIYRDLAKHISEMIGRYRIPSGGGDKAVRFEDIAVLVKTHNEAAEVQRELTKAGIPSVVMGGESVLTSPAAHQWHLLLSALALPSSAPRARAVASSWFFGHDLREIQQADSEMLGEIQEHLHQWSDVLMKHGLAAMVGRMRSDTDVVGRVLAHDDGERSLTDLDHVAELLIALAPVRLSAASLLRLFESLEPDVTPNGVESGVDARRTASEARAVQIMTVFASKGLEFPIVCLPTLWRPTGKLSKAPFWWEPDTGGHGTRMLNVGGSDKWYPKEVGQRWTELAARELLGADLRLLYVALTRAKHHVALWYLPTKSARETGLAHVLFARDANGDLDRARFDDVTVDVVLRDSVPDQLATLAARSNGLIDVKMLVDHQKKNLVVPSQDGSDHSEVYAAELTSCPDRRRVRWSFTKIAPNIPSGNGSQSHEEVESDDVGEYSVRGGGDEFQPADVGDVTNLEMADFEPRYADFDVPAREVLTFDGVTGGAEFGSLVHGIFERIDFASNDLRSEIVGAAELLRPRYPWRVTDDQLVDGFCAILHTPLSARFAGRPLRSLTRADRLDEVDFDFNLATGNHVPTIRRLGSMIADHLDVDDPAHSWAKRLAKDANEIDLVGYLTGSIDLLARIRRQGEPDRFIVCDYKTNILTPLGQIPSGVHYRGAGLVDAMESHHYFLQALIYGVAAHRYLRWRLSDYDPRVNLGGVAYLFVRGMIGSETPITDGIPDGLFDWQPPISLITALSDLLAGSDELIGGLS